MSDDRRQYFDSIAAEWDGWMDMARVRSRIDQGLAHFGLTPEEAVLDVGCGTGNLTQRLLRRLSDHGSVIAVDPSEQMLARARAKNPDPRVEHQRAHAHSLDIAARSLDRVICLSVWPHIDTPWATVRELRRVLRPGGWLHVWHIDSRETINRVHAEAGDAVRGDVLLPADDLAAFLAEAGFEVHDLVDSDYEYLVSARKVDLK